MKFINAPISEVIFGVTLANSLANSSRILEYYCEILKVKYPIVELSNPLGELVIFENGRVENQLDGKLTGQALYRFRTEDKKYLIQIQNNKLYMNWIRTDNESTGDYPGYDKLFPLFKKAVADFLGYFHLTNRDIKSCDLTYHNRFNIDKILHSGKTINDIIKFTIPLNGDKLLNFSNKSSEIMESINSLCNSTMETVFKDQERLLRFEFLIQSIDQLEINYEEWFSSAHKTQVNTFENIFTGEVLESWK